MNCKMVSIDSSSKKTGMAYFENAKLIDYKLIDFSSESDKYERVKLMCKTIIKQLLEWSPNIIYIEDTWNARNIETTKLLSKIIGTVYCYAIQKGCDYHELLPSQWRKFCGIEQGKKTRVELKKASIDYVYKNYGITVNDDVADAISIGCGAINYFNEFA